jgi:CheY-like chemotaxis protein
VIETVRSNEEAIQRVRGREYDLVLSDIHRDSPESVEAETAGLELPKQLMPDRNRVPPVIYYVGTAGASYTEDRYPVTDRPSELFRLIGDVLRWRT